MNRVMDPEEPAAKGGLKNLETALRSDIKNLERMMIHHMERIQREIKGIHASLARIEGRLDAQAIRLDRQIRATRFPT